MGENAEDTAGSLAVKRRPRDFPWGNKVEERLWHVLCLWRGPNRGQEADQFSLRTSECCQFRSNNNGTVLHAHPDALARPFPWNKFLGGEILEAAYILNLNLDIYYQVALHELFKIKRVGVNIG